MMVGRLAKNAVAVAFHGSGALAALQHARRALSGPRVHLIGFHRVVDSLEKLPADVIPSLAISTDSLRQLCLLALRHYEVLPLGDAADVIAGRRQAARDVVAFTFDDGYRDVYLRALPVLRDLGVPATVFVPSGFIGSGEPLLHDRLYALLRRVRLEGRPLRGVVLGAPLRAELLGVESLLRRRHDEAAPLDAVETLIMRLPGSALSRVADALEEMLGARLVPDEGGRVMSAEELRACVEGGLSLGAHTISHVTLVSEPPGRVRVELRRPRGDLETIAGRPCEAFAFCNGLFSPSLLAAVREAGYRVAVTTTDRANRVGDDPLQLGRKVLWEGHARGAFGRSHALLASHLADLFGALKMTRPVDGQQPALRGAFESRKAWSRFA